MRLSKTGWGLAFIYFTLSIVCIIWAFTLVDPKSKFVILQLPLALQMAGLHEIGLLKYFTDISWTMAYIIIGVPTLFIFYCIGWIIEKIFSKK